MSAAPRRQLGLIVTVAIVVANMIGTGIFTSTGFQAAALHDPATMLITWVVGGVLALCGASCYAELGSMMPEAGGEYVYLREAYHPVAGYMSGWVSMTAGFSAPIATSALAFAAYFARVVPGVESHAAQQAVAISLIVAITGLHSFDTKLGGRVQAVLTAMKVALITAFVVLGLASGNGDWSHFASEHGGLANIGTNAFAVSLMYVMFAYSGWNAAAYIAGDVERPERTLPRALLIGTGAVMALYLLLNIVYFYGVSSEKMAGVAEVGALAAHSLLGESGGKLIIELIALALASSVSAMVMAGPRVYATMADHGALPRALGWHSGRGVPTVAVVAQGALAVVFVLWLGLGDLIQFVGFSLTISAAFTCAAVFVLRRRGKTSTYRTFGYPVTPALFIAISAWIAYAQIDANPKGSAEVAAVLGLGALGYLVFLRGSGGGRNVPSS
jgi:APA family basic amino acid/polyamine antiporter